jgi:hypothetical protein
VKSRAATSALVALVLFSFTTVTAAEIELRSYETEFLKLIYYTEDHAYLVPHVARCFENSLAFHRQLFNYTPSEPVVVLLHDFGDYGHGGTSTVPWNYITIGIEPFDYVYETMPANERMNWLMHHELVHVVATDKGAGADNFFRKMFAGKVAPTAEQPLSMYYSYLTSPRWYSPRWYHEGIAVFLETWMAGGLGRLLGGYDEMVFRTMELEKRYFYDIVGLESEGTAIDFQVGQNSYLYGTRFVTYLALQHGPEKLIAWFDREKGSKRYFSSQFKQVYGVPLHEEWTRWIEWEHRWQDENLALIREYPVTEDHPLLEQALGSASRAHYDAATNRVFTAVNYPGRSAHIAAISLEDGDIEKLVNVSSPALYYVTSLAHDAEWGKLYYTTDNTRGWRDLNEVDLATGHKRELIEDCRAGNLVVSPADHSIWAVQHHNGLSSIVRFMPPFEEGWETLLTIDYGKDIFDLDISPDGKSLTASLIEISGRQRLVKMDIDRLLAKQGSFDVLYEFEKNSPSNFVFSPDGRYLYGTSYYSGVSNIYRYDFEAGEIEAVTNAEAGYFRPLPISEDRLFAFRYTAKGLMPVTLPIEVKEDVNAVRYLGQQIVKNHSQVVDWNAGSPLKIDLEEATRYSGEYKAAKRIGLASIIPVVEGYRDTFAVGARLHFADPVGMNSINLTAAISEQDADRDDEEQLHLRFRYDHFPWSIQAGHNSSDFYDLFGPTKVSRKGTWARVGMENYIINRRPRTFKYHFDISGYTGLDTVPEYQNIAATSDEYVSLSGGLNYNHLRGTIGGIEAEKGLSWDFGSVNNYVDGELLSRAYTNFDFGFLTPIDHSSIWLRSSAGYSFGDPEQTFSNFYFGGFGNNWVDHLSAKRYREYYSFPGLELNEIEANNYGKLTLEWTLPAVKFRRLGAPGFYANWMQFSLFSSGIVANFTGDLEQRELGTAGVQVDFKVVMFSNLESTLSFGWASAFEEGHGPEREIMASLKLLR